MKMSRVRESLVNSGTWGPESSLGQILQEPRGGRREGWGAEEEQGSQGSRARRQLPGGACTQWASEDGRGKLHGKIDYPEATVSYWFF